jgi:hypothetical protein
LLLVGPAAAVSSSAFRPVAVAAHRYDGAAVTSATALFDVRDSSADQGARVEATYSQSSHGGYDDSSNPARTLARPGDYRLAAETGPDFVAGPIGSEPPVPVSQSRMAAGFDEAGFPSTPTASPGTEYTLPDGSKVRLMEPSGQAPMRASFTNPNGGPINPFTGKPVQPPAPAGWSMTDWVRALTHVEQTP